MRYFPLLASVMFLAGCRQDMQDQPKYKTFRESDFFPDRLSARPPMPGTVARGQLYEDELLYNGKVGGKLSEVFPFPVTREVIRRGQERFNIYCSPCHGRLGNGEGMIVQRGFRKPPSYHIDRLRNAPAGHFFDVITNGFGAMTDYAARVEPRDRWAIIAYIRALQLSENARLSDVPPENRADLPRTPRTPPGTEAGAAPAPAASPGGPNEQGREPMPSEVTPGRRPGGRR